MAMMRPGDDDLMAEINITPFTDVLLVLLIIFMVSATAMVQAGFNIKLPQAAAHDPQKPSPVTLNVTQDGRIHIDSDVMTLAELPPYLQQLKERVKTDHVVIIADERVPYGQVISVMDAARAAGLVNVGLAARRKP
ncbi:MAG: ExbD/TolR family protein [Candidatus Xenobia bacterium]